MTTAREYLQRPCNISGTPLYWAVCGATVAGDGAGVLAWCWDEDDAMNALRAIKRTNQYVGLTVENLSGGE